MSTSILEEGESNLSFSFIFSEISSSKSGGLSFIMFWLFSVDEFWNDWVELKVMKQICLMIHAIYLNFMPLCFFSAFLNFLTDNF